MTYIILLMFCIYIALYNNKDLILDINSSYLLTNNENYKLNLILFSILFPLTIYFLIQNKLMKNLTKILVVFIILLITIKISSKSIQLYNESVSISADFKANLNKRGTTFDKMKKILSEKFQISQIADSSYSHLVELITESRKDGVNLTWKWLRENNANINYEEVSKFYMDVSSNISLLRNQLEIVENQLQTNGKEWDLLHNKFPNKLYLFYQNKELFYNPILSTISMEINKTGVDNENKIK